MFKLTYTEKFLLLIIFFSVVKILDKRLHLENSLLFVSFLMIFFLIVLQITLRKIFPDLSKKKIFVILISITVAFMISIPLETKYQSQNMINTSVYYEGYLDSQKFYADDIPTLTQLSRVSNITTDKEFLIHVINLWSSGKLHITKEVLNCRFYETSNQWVVAFVSKQKNGEFIRGYTFKQWVQKIK